MKKEYDLRKLKVKQRGPVLRSNAKVSQALSLDADVVRWLVAEAARRGIRYEALLNTTLRAAMKQALRGAERPATLRAEIRKIVREELQRAS